MELALRRFAASANMRVAALVFCVFSLTSTGWLLWVNRLASMTPPVNVDLIALVWSYVAQAVGTAAYVALSQWRPKLVSPRTCAVLTSAFVACLIPALQGELMQVISIGLLANLLCGVLQGHYLTALASQVGPERRGTVFGGAYAASTLASWCLASLLLGAETRTYASMALCLSLAIASAVLMAKDPLPTTAKPAADMFAALRESPVMLAGILVLLMSTTKSLGYGFPAADLSSGISLETSRLFYGVGLLCAGILGDRDRTYGAFCCMCSLVTPFLSLSLAGANAPSTLLWALGYFLFGFFAVYRVTLFADLASAIDAPHLAGAGLLLGRLGDAAGTALCLAAGEHTVFLIALTAVFFLATTGVFFAYARRLQASEPEPEPEPSLSEEELFEQFWRGMDLSPRQAEVLRLMLDGCTNQQIATKLVVSDNTVKFHVRNVLKKTGCRNRVELQGAWSEYRLR